MNVSAEKITENNIRSASNAAIQNKRDGNSSTHLTDNRLTNGTAIQLKTVGHKTSGIHTYTSLNELGSYVGPAKPVQLKSGRTNHGVIQRKPKSDLLTTGEETAISTLIAQHKFQEAVTAASKVGDLAGIAANITKFEYKSGLAEYGKALQDIENPAGVDIEIGPLAMSDITVLISTLYHEIIHAKQMTRASGEDIGTATNVFGYAKEGSPYMVGAQEIETHVREIVFAIELGTHQNLAFMTSRGVSLSNYWKKLYNASKGKASSKPAKYRKRMSVFVKMGYEKLEGYGVDTSTYDKRGLG